MSLINDALKRAQQAQQTAPAPESPGPQLRPEGIPSKTRRGAGLMVPVSLALVALLGLLLVWQIWRHYLARGSQDTPPAVAELPVHARQAAAPMLEPTPLPPPAASPAPTAKPAPATSPALTAVTPETAVPAETAPATSTATNAVVAAPEPPKPEPLRLQGIVYSPRRPSAVVSGKTVFVGDRVRDFRVSAITAENVTLFRSGETIVLTLP